MIYTTGGVSEPPSSGGTYALSEDTYSLFTGVWFNIEKNKIR
jgi:hypothetical protein